MKKFRKIMAVLVAAMMIMATMVPAWAATPGTGTRDKETPDTGSIEIRNAEDGETYKVYKIFDLYSFVDDDVTINQHNIDKEHYAYMIKYSSSDASWYKFVYDRSTNASAENALFTIDLDNPYNPSGSADTYYFVKSTGIFNYVTPTSSDTTQLEDEDGRAGSIDDTGATTIRQAVQQFAKDALDWAVSKSIDADKTGIALTGSNATNNANSVTVSTTNAASNKVTVTFSGLDLGYYLVDSSIGTMVALDTTTTSVIMNDKNEIPSIEKKVRVNGTKEDQNRDNSTNIWSAANRDTVWVENTDYEIGEKITFLTTIHVPFGAKSYKYYDVLEKGFDLDLNDEGDGFATGALRLFYSTASSYNDAVGQYRATAMKKDMVAGDDLSADGVDYKVVVNPTATNADFSIEFSDNFLYKLNDNAVIEIEYDAYLNHDAFVKGDTAEAADDAKKTTIATAESRTLEGDPVALKDVPEAYYEHNADQANTNSGILLFGNNSSTAWDTATVETYQFDLIKTKEDFNNDKAWEVLGGAEFELYKVAKVATGAINTSANPPYVNTAVQFVNDGKKYMLPENGNTETTVAKLVSVNSGELNIRGLEKGTYYLKETKAPVGFQVIGGYFKIVINDTGSTTEAPATTAPTITVTWIHNTQASPTDLVEEAYQTNAAWDIADTTTTSYSTATSENGLHIVNKTTTELPSTGGMGTTVLYIVGGMLVILAGAYLFFSRKRTA